MLKEQYSEIYNEICLFLGKCDISCIKNNEGQNNIVFEIDDSYILRISRSEESNFDDEMQILDYIDGCVNINIPKPLLHGNKKTRFLYKKIKGKKLNSEIINILNTKQYTKLVDQLSHFMTCMHSLYTNRLVAKIGLYAYDKSYNNYRKLKLACNIINNDLIKKLSLELTKQYSEYILLHQQIQLGLLHNDLYENNIYVDSEYNPCVIDFGDVTFADIHCDFTYFYHPDHNLQQDIISSYTVKSGNFVDADYVMLNTKIFIINIYLKDIVKHKKYKLWIDKWIQDLI